MIIFIFAYCMKYAVILLVALFIMAECHYPPQIKSFIKRQLQETEKSVCPAWSVNQGKQRSKA